jgi:hypothetical protein
MAKGESAVHESFARAEDVKLGSERSFGFVFAGFCALVAATMLWRLRPEFWYWIYAAAAFATAALLAPRLLYPLNYLWFKLGLLLHHIITPVVLALMFYTVFTPIGLWMRIAGKRPLNLKFEPASDSYWIPREPPGPSAPSFRNQF